MRVPGSITDRQLRLIARLPTSPRTLEQ